MNDYDKDNDGRLDPQELLSWVVPNNQGIAQEEVSYQNSQCMLCVTDRKGNWNPDPKKGEMELFKMDTLFCFELNDETLSYYPPKDTKLKSTNLRTQSIG